MTDLVTPRRALLSVSDKTGLVELAEALAGHGVELVSTGGTARALAAAGLPVTDVADVTGLPEMMGGRVKTLHPFIHGGILARRDDPEHQGAMEAYDIVPIDLVIVNLYPFEQAVASGANYDACVEEIDVGGPAMLRAAAKNHAHVAVVTDVEDYPALLSELQVHGGTTLPFRQRLALTAFGRTAAYDAAIAEWLGDALAETAPRRRGFAGRLAQVLRYGENPHQGAAFYADEGGRPGVATARQVGGKELSFNNIADADAAWELVADLPADRAACAVVKHANPCGVALGETPAEAYRRAFDCDRVSAFGGIVALNRPLDRAAAEAITGVFTEVVIAPDADEGALAVFGAKPNLRLLLGPLPDPEASRLAFRQVAGGWLVQDADVKPLGPAGLTVVTKRQPTEAEWADLAFAWRVAKHVKSNAIVYAKGAATVGIGAGQMSRLDSTRIAARKAQDMAEALGLTEPTTRGSVVASDAFFPFADGLVAAAEAGATAVIQPGGSVRDAELVAAADERGLAMVFTGRRHFRH